MRERKRKVNIYVFTCSDTVTKSTTDGCYSRASGLASHLFRASEWQLMTLQVCYKVRLMSGGRWKLNSFDIVGVFPPAGRGKAV